MKNYLRSRVDVKGKLGNKNGARSVGRRGWRGETGRERLLFSEPLSALTSVIYFVVMHCHLSILSVSPSPPDIRATP